MERVRQLVFQHQDKLKLILIAGSGLAAFNTLARPDFNLILYLYIFYVWNNMSDSKESQTTEKVYSFFALLYSLIIDFVWCLFWGSRWGMKNDNEAFIHSLVIFTSWLAILVKLVCLTVVGMTEWNIIKASLPAKLQEKLYSGNYQEQRDEPGA